MTNTTYRPKTSYIATAATATILVLSFPSFGETNAATLTPAYFHEFEPLADASKPVSEALASSNYTRAAPESVFSLLTKVATRLISESKPLDRDFAKVVEKEFWNLLQ